MSKEKVYFACIIRTEKKGCVSLEVPDLSVKVYGNNYTEVVANAIETISAIYIYRTERNIPVRIKETFDSCTARTQKERGEHFVYMLQPQMEL